MTDQAETTPTVPADQPSALPGESAPGAMATAGGAAVDIAAVLGSYLLLGLLGGVLWWLLVDPAMFTKVGGGGSMGELQLAQRFAGDGWYAVIAGVGGLAAGVALTWWRMRDLLLTTVLLLVGAGVAAAVMAVTGHLLGPGDPDAALATAAAGDQVPVPLTVHAKAGYLVWPMASLVGALVVLWSPPRDAGDAADL